MLYYPFEVLSSGATKDYSSNGLNGTISGATEVKQGFYKNTVTVAKEGGDFTSIQMQ